MTIFILIFILISICCRSDKKSSRFIIKRAFHMLKWIKSSSFNCLLLSDFLSLSVCPFRFWFYCKKNKWTYLFYVCTHLTTVLVFFFVINEPFNLWVLLVKYSKKSIKLKLWLFYFSCDLLNLFSLKVKSAWNDRFRSYFFFNKKVKTSWELPVVSFSSEFYFACKLIKINTDFVLLFMF